MNTKVVPISEVKPNESNPRFIKNDKFKKLVKSIKDFPKMLDIRPIVVDSTMVVLGGNMRLKACIEAGLSEVPIIIADDLTEDQKKEFVVKDNLGYGEWDWDVIEEQYDKDLLEDWGMDLPTSIFLEDAAGADDGYEVPSNVLTSIVPGDYIEIGPHRLFCGDSTQTDTFKKLFNDNFCDLVITDPPYNVNYEGKTRKKLTIQNDSMSDDNFYRFLYDFYTALSAYCKAGAGWYVWHADLEGANFRQAMKDAGIMVKQCLIWVKNSMVMGRQDYQWKHEPCLYGWKEGAAHSWYSDRKQTTVLNFDRPQRNEEYPTMKPIPLIAYQIQNSSKAGDIIADGFGGSGTTMVAAQQLDRRCFMVEFDPKYCQVIVERMKLNFPQLPITINGIPYVEK